MPKISIYADAEFLATMKSLLESVLESLSGELIVHVDLPDEDPDLLDAWVTDLKEHLKEDLRYLETFFDRIPNEDDEIEVDLEESEAENFVRACSAIRLRIRQTVFRRHADEELEDRELNLDRLTREEQYCFTFYEFLGLMQEQVVAFLEGDENDESDGFFELPFPEE